MSGSKLKHQVRQNFLSRDITFMSHWRLRYTMTGKQIDTAIDAFLVSLPVKYCDILQHASDISYNTYSINAYVLLLYFEHKMTSQSLSNFTELLACAV